jgi:hypothetical protein
MKAGWGAYIFMIQKDASIERKYWLPSQGVNFTLPVRAENF